MDITDSPRRYPDGHWSPPQSQYQSQSWSPPPRHPETHDMSISEGSPRSQDGYYIQPAPPSKEYAFQPPLPPSSPMSYSAPEVAEHFVQFPQYDHNRPLSPSSGRGSTLVSPHIPPFSLNEKVEPFSRATSVPPPEEPKKACGLRRRTFYIILLIVLLWLVVIGVGLGVGLSLGLKRDKSAAPKVDPYCEMRPEVCIGGALDERYYSKKGAFNGSGIALAGESWNKDQRKIFTLYFQHWTGDIRFMQYTTDRKWIGGTRAQTIATDAKNSTPISAVAYSLNNTQKFHLFYVSADNKLRQMTQTNVTNIWESGPLSSLNLAVQDAPSVGLQACWKGNFYGDSDFSKFPTASGEENAIPFEELNRGINIWYPLDESTFQQYAWYEGQDEWIELDKWQGKNTHAGVGCYSWGEGTTTYTMMVNRNNDTEIWWKDTNTNLTSEDDHPINSWRNSTEGAIDDVYPSTSLGFTTYFYAQMDDKSIKGFNVSYQAENTTIVDEDTFTITDPAGPVEGLGGTHLTVTAYAEKQGEEVLWDSLYVFYQTEGDDITAFTRPIAGGEWTRGNLTIPLD